jgi:hypothetical protein
MAKSIRKSAKQSARARKKADKKKIRTDKKATRKSARSEKKKIRQAAKADKEDIRTSSLSRKKKKAQKKEIRQGKKKKIKKVSKALKRDLVEIKQEGLLMREYPGVKAIAGQKRKIKLLTWNIYMMPKGGGYHDNTARVQALKKAFLDMIKAKQEPDILLFQKAFTAAEREVLEAALNKTYRYFYAPWKPKKPILNNGLWVVSKLKLDLVKEINWCKARGAELFAAKGAMVFSGCVNSKRFHLVSLHMQGNGHPVMKKGDRDTEIKYPAQWERKKASCDKTRRKQIDQLVDEAITPFKGKKISQLVCGDFSVDRNSENYCYLVDTLKLHDGTQMLITADSIENNSFARKWIHEGQQKDYVLLHTNGGGLSNSHISRRLCKIAAPFVDKHKQRHCYISYRHAVEAVVDFR